MERGGLINFLPLKRGGGLIRGRGLIWEVSVIEDLQYVRFVGHIITDSYASLSVNGRHLICFVHVFCSQKLLRFLYFRI